MNIVLTYSGEYQVDIYDSLFFPLDSFHAYFAIGFKGFRKVFAQYKKKLKYTHEKLSPRIISDATVRGSTAASSGSSSKARCKVALTVVALTV